MTASKVYFADMRATLTETIPQKLARLIRTAGLDELELDGQFVAIKMHFGERGNLAFLRPNYARVVADMVKERGGLPFLTDSNTLYVGSRKNALEHLDTAMENGFSPLSTGCQIIIADGLTGSDDVEVPVEGGEYIEKAKIGRAIMDADAIITLTHFKGHEMAGFGGTLKNVAMGCGSRAGKMEMHSDGKPRADIDACTGCRICARFCAHDAIDFVERKAVIDHERCAGCGRCVSACKFDAIGHAYDENAHIMNRKMAEYCKAVLDGRPQFHISLVIDVSPYCDCHAENDAPVVADVGMFASFDPVALDCACADAVNRQTPFENSALGEAHREHGADSDHFHALFAHTDWRTCTEHAEKLGVGRCAYELIDIDARKKARA